MKTIKTTIQNETIAAEYQYTKGIVDMTITAPAWCAGAATSQPCFEGSPDEVAPEILSHLYAGCLILREKRAWFASREYEYNRRWQKITNIGVDITMAINKVKCYADNHAISYADAEQILNHLNRRHRELRRKRADLPFNLIDTICERPSIRNLIWTINKVCGTNLNCTLSTQIWRQPDESK